MFRLHFLAVPLIICALLASQGLVRADEREIQGDPVEPGVAEFTDDVEGPVEPGNTVLVSQNTTAALQQGPPEPSTRPAFSENSASSQGPLEPSTRPAFSGSSPVGQGPPEPSTRPAFTGSSVNQGPPEPSTRPVFSGNSASAPNQGQGPLEPSTRPAFSGPSSVGQGPPEPSTRPAFTGSNVNQGPPEPSTRPAFSGNSGSTVSQGPPEPSTRPHFGNSSNTQPQQGSPEPSTRPHFSSSSASSSQGPPEPQTRPHYVSQQRPTVVVTRAPAVTRAPTPAYYPNYPNSYYSQPKSRYQDEPSQVNYYYHLHDHPSLVNQRYDRPFSQQVWRCDLRVNNCFLKNKVNFVPFETQYNFEGTYNAMVLDVGKAARKRHDLTRRPNPVRAYNAGRLESTSYFEAQYADACVAFSYFWNGQGRKSVHVLQRSQEDVCIYSATMDPNDRNSRSTTGQWQDLQLQIDLRYGPAKFFIEYEFDIGEKRQYPQTYDDLGFVAVRNFSIGYGSCTQRSESWECDVPSSRR